MNSQKSSHEIDEVSVILDSLFVGDFIAESVGDRAGKSVGDTDGFEVDDVDGVNVGPVGNPVGKIVGFIGDFVGSTVGNAVGNADRGVGNAVGLSEGDEVNGVEGAVVIGDLAGITSGSPSVMMTAPKSALECM